MTQIAVDASVAAKWFGHKEAATKAVALLASDNELSGPALLLSELSSVFWKWIRRGDFTLADAQRALAITSQIVELIPMDTLAQEALDLAVAANVTPYDAMYVVAARSRRARLVTADRKLCLAMEANSPLDDIVLLDDL